MPDTLRVVLEWLGAVAGAGWVVAVPGFLYSHRKELQAIGETVDTAVSEVRTLRDEWNAETQTKG